MFNISCIYKIQSIKIPDRIYVGSAIKSNQRWNSHLSKLRKNKHHSPKLQHHFNKYGESDLLFSVLLGCEKEDLIKHEQFFIDSLKPWFNINLTAGSPLGRKHSQETIEKLRKIHTGMPGPNKGKPRSEECKEKIRRALTGKKLSKETCIKLSIIRKGRKVSLESRAKISKAKMGYKQSPEHVRNNSESHKGLIQSLESRQKKRDSMIRTLAEKKSHISFIISELNNKFVNGV